METDCCLVYSNGSCDIECRDGEVISEEFICEPELPCSSLQISPTGKLTHKMVYTTALLYY